MNVDDPDPYDYYPNHIYTRAEIWSAITRLTKRGWSIRQIAAHLQINKTTVQRVRRRMDVAPRRVNRPWTPNELEKANLLFQDGCSYSEVARTVGRSVSSVRRRFPGRGWTDQQAKELQSVQRRFEYRDRLDHAFTKKDTRRKDPHG